MRFCPKCGGMMMPYRKDGKTVLRCTKCGFELDTGNITDYRIGGPTAASRVMTTSLVSEGRARAARTKEEIEQEKEEYYKELFLELLREEEYGEEEGG